MAISGDIDGFLHAVEARARSAGVFGEVRRDGPRLIADAKESAAPAEYRVDVVGAEVWVSLVTADRWLSQSIEQDLVHTGDKIDDLLAEELVELGWEGAVPPSQHFRSEDKLFTFRTKAPIAGAVSGANAAAVEAAAAYLLGYEACFSRLGDMSGGDDE